MAGIGPVNTAQAMFGATTMRALEATSETRIIRDAMSRAVEGVGIVITSRSFP